MIQDFAKLVTNGKVLDAVTTLDLGPAFTKIAEGTIQVKDAQGNVTSEYWNSTSELGKCRITTISPTPDYKNGLMII